MESPSRILVVDDTPINLELLCNAVRQLGYEVIAAGSAKEALQHLVDDNIDLVLLDYLMPDMSGMEVLQTIRSNPLLKLVPVIMVTGYYDTSVVIQALECGANEYINKPFEYEVLKVRINAQLQRRKLEQEMMQARQLAQSANRSKSRFLSFVSHELRSPLNSVIGYCDLLELIMTRDGVTSYLENLSHIKSASQHILHIANDLLDLMQIEAGKLKINYQNVALPGLIAAIVAEMQPAMELNHNKLKVQLGTELDPVTTDEVRFRQIVDNLLSNGAKNTRDGEIALRVEKIREQRKSLLRISVSDNGRGIAKEKLDDLFNEFSPGHQSYSAKRDSAGLGLLITRHLCEQMGGQISVASEQGSGTTFTVMLPCEQAGAGNGGWPTLTGT